MLKTERLNFGNKSELISHLSEIKNIDFDKDLLIYDTNIKSTFVAEFASRFRYKKPVVAGEVLKDLLTFPKYFEEVEQLLDIEVSRQSRVIALGGGSVGDFSGFLASIWKRGVKLVHIPSTWLSAMDSAHGGKTALNAGGAKNQLGTFYPAEKIYLAKELLLDQPEELGLDAYGEMLKISYLGPDKFINEIITKPVSFETLWSYLKRAVDNKYEFVNKDPYEEFGVRKALNLGHTLGHAYEATFSLSHGRSVCWGLLFAYEWSSYKKYISADVMNPVVQFIKTQILKGEAPQFSSQGELTKLLLKDKKMKSSGKIDFIFCKNEGYSVEPVTVGDIISECRRQGYLNV